MVNQSEAVLREFNLYPVWVRRDLPVEAVLPVELSEQIIASTDTVLTAPVDFPKVDPSAADWPRLTKMVQDCQACDMRAGCQQTVMGAGDRQADWLIVAGEMSVEEAESGQVLVGAVGKLFDNILAAMHLKRETKVYLTHSQKCYSARAAILSKVQMASCLPYLQREIALVQPKIILVLGETAARALLGEAVPRGTLTHYQHIPLLVIDHPADLLRKPETKAQAWRDLQLAVATVAGQNPA